MGLRFQQKLNCGYKPLPMLLMEIGDQSQQQQQNGTISAHQCGKILLLPPRPTGSSSSLSRDERGLGLTTRKIAFVNF
jgi:hypothetical protein